MKRMGKLISCILLSLVLLCGCMKEQAETEGEGTAAENTEKVYTADDYWVNQGVTMVCGKEFDMAILEIEGTNLDQDHVYQVIYEKDIQELNLPYNPQLDAYLQRVADVLIEEATDNMLNIVVANMAGVYEGKIWYFLVESYTDTNTGNKVVDIMGLHDEGVKNLVVLDIGIEDKMENIPREVIEGFLEKYELNWTYEEVMGID